MNLIFFIMIRKVASLLYFKPPKNIKIHCKIHVFKTLYKIVHCTSGFERKLAASYLEEEDVGCWKEIVIPVVKSGRAASMRAPQLRAVRTHDQRDNRCADIKTPVLLTQHTDKKKKRKKDRAQEPAAIHLSAVSITIQLLHLLHCKRHSEMHFKCTTCVTNRVF